VSPRPLAAAKGALSFLRVSVLGLLGMAAGFLVLAFLLASIAERHDVCACRDGSHLSGWAWGLRSPARHCAALCEGRGGGEALPPRLKPPGSR